MKEQRENWSSRLGFILAAAGSAIGLGTMWKLPYVMGQNGGGAFILLFILFNILIGIPLFIVELLLGRLSKKSAVSAFADYAGESSSWKIVGWVHVIGAMIILGWYCVIGGWGFNYIIMSLTDSFHSKTPDQLGLMFEAFRSSGDINIFWQLMFLAATAAIVVKGISAGIEHWSRVMTIGLFVVLIVLSAYAYTLDGFASAFKYLIYPDFKNLSASGVLEALSMALFTLSLGYGIMITYGSYMKESEDIPKTALIVGGANLIVSILIALMIFPIIFTFGFAPTEGEGLIFKALPYAFGQLPGSILISTLFFSLLLFAALTSSVSILEVSVANLMDLKQWSRKKAVLVSTFITFLIGIPTALGGTNSIFSRWPEIYGETFLRTTDILSNWFISFAALMTSIYVGYILPSNDVKQNFGSGSTMARYYPAWRFLIRYVLPTAIFFILLQRARIIDVGIIDKIVDHLA